MISAHMICHVNQPTRNSSVDEIGKINRLNHAIVTNIRPITQFFRNVRLSYRRITIFSAHGDDFLDYCAL